MRSSTHTVMVEASRLVKRYDKIIALDGFDLSIPAGAIYALLGPNGAGKTTAINILTTLTKPDKGAATIAGHDVVRSPNAVRCCIGVTFQDLVLDADLTGRQVLDFHGRLYKQPSTIRRRKIDEMVDLMQLGASIDRLVKTYSGGMKRRLELARGLMTDPLVLFLDEPTLGLDPQNRAAIWQHILQLKRAHGLTVLLTTHYMEEAATLADIVGIIDAGHKIAEGAPDTLVAEVGSDVIRISGNGDASHLLERLHKLPYVARVEQEASGHVIEVGVDCGSRRLAEVINQAGGNGYLIHDVVITRPNLEDVFLKHTGRTLRDEGS